MEQIQPTVSLEFKAPLSWSHHEFYYMTIASNNKNSPRHDKNVICHRFFKYSLIILMVCIISMFWKLIFDRYHINFLQVYDNRSIYYINDVILNAYCCISIIGFIFIFVDNILHCFIQKSKQIMFIVFILYIFALIICLLSFLLHNTVHGLINNESSLFCKHFICDKFIVY
eukprot:9493_1